MLVPGLIGWQMLPWTPILALSIFPLAYLLAGNPLQFCWGFRHGSEAVPPELHERIQHIDRYVLVARGVLILGLLAALIVHQSIPDRRIGLHLSNFPPNALIGLSAGLVNLALQGMILKFIPRVNEKPNNPELRSGPVWFWILATPFGVFAEELWIAVSIVLLLQTLHSTLVSISVTAAVFGLMHFAYRPGGILAIALYGAISGWLFVSRGSLLPSFLFHCIGNVGALYWARRTTVE